MVAGQIATLPFLVGGTLTSVADLLNEEALLFNFKMQGLYVRLLASIEHAVMAETIYTHGIYEGCAMTLYMAFALALSADHI